MLDAKTRRSRRATLKMTSNSTAAQISGMLQNAVRQETTRIRVPSPNFPNAQKSKHRFFFLHNGTVHSWVRQETAKIHVPSSGLKTQKNRKTSKICISRIGSELSLPICCRMWSAKRRAEFTYLRRVFKTFKKSNIDLFFTQRHVA